MLVPRPCFIQLNRIDVSILTCFLCPSYSVPGKNRTNYFAIYTKSIKNEENSQRKKDNLQVARVSGCTKTNVQFAPLEENLFAHMLLVETIFLYTSLSLSNRHTIYK